MANAINFYDCTIEEVNRTFTTAVYDENYHNGIGKSEGNTVNLWEKDALKAHGFVESGWLKYTNQDGITIHAEEGENQNAFYRDPQIFAVTNRQGTLLCGSMGV